MTPKSILKQRTVSGQSDSAFASPKRTIVVPGSTSTSQARPARAAHRADKGRSQDDPIDESNAFLGEEEKEEDDDDAYGDDDDDDDDDDEEEDGDVDLDQDEFEALGQRSGVSSGGTKSTAVKMASRPPPLAELKNPTLKPTPAPAFSQALSHLLSLPPTAASLAPKVTPPSAHTQRLDRKARSVLRESKAQHFARGHVPDVIAGWGARPPLPFSLWESNSAREFERARRGGDSSLAEVVVESGAEREKRLRKLAQRGVVRLFNAIGAAQGVPDRLDREDVKRRRTIEKVATGLPPIDNGLLGGKAARQPNVLGGRGKGEALSNLSKQSFLDLVRAGTT
ncbi:BQ2448_3909 [Microbotryum intermedium]|uniref:BQ2448_3909 protein n=1 Tax=Microbotryum intermedium TaxID=269621 RepID=A0A238FEX5_9BASI|nr:BQ2448_3909 [Microbotryum intermedium]